MGGAARAQRARSPGGLTAGGAGQLADQDGRVAPGVCINEKNEV
jgi:hypothetical protein